MLAVMLEPSKETCAPSPRLVGRVCAPDGRVSNSTPPATKLCEALPTALKNGVTLEELQALLLHASIYAGVPASNAAFRWMRDVLGDELDKVKPA